MFLLSTTHTIEDIDRLQIWYLSFLPLKVSKRGLLKFGCIYHYDNADRQILDVQRLHAHCDPNWTSAPACSRFWSNSWIFFCPLEARAVKSMCIWRGRTRRAICSTHALRSPCLSNITASFTASVCQLRSNPSKISFPIWRRRPQYVFLRTLPYHDTTALGIGSYTGLRNSSK